MSNQEKHQAALSEALLIAETYYCGAEIHANRHLFTFDARGIFVVADKDVSQLGLAVLIIEQIAILEAQQNYHAATAMTNFSGVMQ